MVTITDIIRHAIATQATQIRQLKVNAIETKPAKKLVYFSADGKDSLEGQPTKEQFAAGYRAKEVSYDKIVKTISPKHADWNLYQAYKRQVSMLLTARVILKHLAQGGGSIPSHAEHYVILDHAPHYKAKQVSKAAVRYLRKLENRLKNHPEKFSAVEKWLADYQQLKEVVNA